jgi:hypothetical protein
MKRSKSQLEQETPVTGNGTPTSEAWIEGWLWAVDDTVGYEHLGDADLRIVAKDAYREWKKEQRNEQ